MDTVAVIPAYNEARTIGTVVIQTKQYVQSTIVVDDGSDDNTAEIATNAGADVIRLPQNKGKGEALQTGFSRAIELEPDVVVTLDGDGQHDPRNIDDLLAPLKAGDAEFIIGARTDPGDGNAMYGRQMGRQVLDLLTNTVAGSDISDTQSGFRAVRIETLEDILPSGNGLGVESEMIISANRASVSIEEVDISDHYPEEASSSANPISHGLSVIFAVIRVVRSEHPLLFFGGFGILALSLGFIYGYETMTHYYATREFWPGKAMLSMLLSIIGTQLLTGGLIMDFLSQSQ